MKIILLTQISKEWASLGDLVEPGKVKWCKKWGVEYRREELPLLYNGLDCWQRPKAWLRNLQECDWLFFMGADTIITNLAIGPKTFINLGAEFIFCLDSHGLQSDVFWLKNTEASRQMLDWIIYNPTNERHEQDALVTCLTGEPRYTLNRQNNGEFDNTGQLRSDIYERTVREHRNPIRRFCNTPSVKIVPQKWLNAYPHEIYGWSPKGSCTWEPGCFVLHMPGQSLGTRLRTFPRYLAMVKNEEDIVTQSGAKDHRNRMQFYNELHLGDCLWSVTYFNLILEHNDFDIVFYANPTYFGELGELVHPAYQDRIEFRPLFEVNKDAAIDTWIGASVNHFQENKKENKQEIQAMCFRLFSDISAKHGIVFPLVDKSEFIYDHPWLDGDNEMLRREGNPEILFVNSVPMSGQFTQNDSDLSVLYDTLKGKKVFTTKRISGFPCTQDYGLSLLQIGQIANRAKTIIGIQTGPFCACVNASAIRNVKSWCVLVWKNNSEMLFHNIGGKFSVCETATEAVGLLKTAFNRPDVSVLMSLYHGEKYLEEHLKSFANQTIFNRTQLVICHNEPTEKELAVIKSFDSEHPGIIKHIIKDKLTNWAESMNECAQHADADILAIGNVDDIRSPDALRQQFEFLQNHPDYDVVHGNNKMVSVFGSFDGWTLENAQFVDDRPELLSAMCLGPFFAWRKSAMEKCGYFDEQFRVSADFDLAMRLARKVKIGSIGINLGFYLNEGAGLSTRGDGIETMDSSVIKTRYGIPLRKDETDAFNKVPAGQYSIRDVRWFGKTYENWIQHFFGSPAAIIRESVSVLVSSYNQHEKLKFFLESMYRQNEPPLEVIVTDDGSTDGTIEWLDSLQDDHYPFPVRYVRRSHGGYRLASLQNFGARHARGRRLLFTNADVLHCPTSISSHARMSDNLLGVGIIRGISVEGTSLVTIGTILDFNQIIRLEETHRADLTNLRWGFYNLNSNPIAVWGGNFSVPADTFEKVGGFDESYMGWGGEDANLAGRYCDIDGCKLDWVKNSVAFHLGHPLKTYSHRQLGSIKYRNSR